MVGKGYVYLLKLNQNVSTFKKGECYVGKHCGSKEKYFTSGTIPCNLINTHGKDIFDRIILAEGDLDNDLLNLLEIEYIKVYNSFRPENGSGLNLTRGGDGVPIDQKGSNNPSSKLDESQVEEILLLFQKGLFLKDLAKDFDVSPQSIYRIIKGETWSNVRKDIDRNELMTIANKNKITAVKENSKSGRLNRRKFNKHTVNVIRLSFADGEKTIRGLAKEYNVSPGTISDIVYRRSYKNL